MVGTRGPIVMYMCHLFMDDGTWDAAGGGRDSCLSSQVECRGLPDVQGLRLSECLWPADGSSDRSVRVRAFWWEGLVRLLSSRDR